MLRKANDVIGLKLGARDGEIGKIRDLYFDDEHLTVRYFVADTGTWLTGRKVLISPHAVKRIESEHVVEVDLTRRQIEESPSIDEHMPVSRQFEIEYYQHYNWPIYWGGPWAWGDTPFPSALPPEAMPRPTQQAAAPQGADAHLRSVQDVIGYEVQARNDHFGHVNDFVLEDADWAFRYLVAATGHWWAGKKVLLASDWISQVNWAEARVHVDLDRDAVRHAPEFDASKPIYREYEEQLFRHYGREPYWRRQPGVAKAA